MVNGARYIWPGEKAYTSLLPLLQFVKSVLPLIIIKVNWLKISDENKIIFYSMKTSLYKEWMDTMYKHCCHCLNRKTMLVFIRELLVTIEIEEVHRQILLYLYLFTNIFVSQSLSQIFVRFLQLFVIRERKERRGVGAVKNDKWVDYPDFCRFWQTLPPLPLYPKTNKAC